MLLTSLLISGLFNLVLILVINRRNRYYKKSLLEKDKEMKVHYNNFLSKDTELAIVQEQHENTKHEVFKKGQELHNAESKLRKANEEASFFNDELSKKESKIALVEAKLKIANSAAVIYNNEIAKKEETIVSLQNELETTKGYYSAANQELAKKTEQYVALREVVDNKQLAFEQTVSILTDKVNAVVLNYVNVYINYVNPRFGYIIPYNLIFEHNGNYYMFSKKHNNPLVISKGDTKENLAFVNFNLPIKKESAGRLRILLVAERTDEGNFFSGLFFAAIKAAESYKK
jgi:hypothetical protein